MIQIVVNLYIVFIHSWQICSPGAFWVMWLHNFRFLHRNRKITITHCSIVPNVQLIFFRHGTSYDFNVCTNQCFILQAKRSSFSSHLPDSFWRQKFTHSFGYFTLLNVILNIIIIHSASACCAAVVTQYCYNWASWWSSRQNSAMANRFLSLPSSLLSEVSPSTGKAAGL